MFTAANMSSGGMDTETVAPVHNGMLSVSQNRGPLSPETVQPNLKGTVLNGIGQDL